VIDERGVGGEVDDELMKASKDGAPAWIADPKYIVYSMLPLIRRQVNKNLPRVARSETRTSIYHTEEATDNERWKEVR
jgi:hypothetical protein